MLAVLAVLVPISAPASMAESAPGPRDYTMEVWAAEKGAPPGDIFSIVQDIEGYLWLGGPSGLLRFDGARFTPWTSSDPGSTLPSGPVHGLVGSHDGSLWVGFGGGGGVVRIVQGKVHRHRPADGAPPGVTSMMQDRDGTIWVATRRGLYRFADDKWSLTGEAQGLGAGDVFSLYEDRVGRLWVGTSSGVYVRSTEVFELVDGSATNVQSLTEDAGGNIWVTDPQDILRRLGSRRPIEREGNIRLPSGAWRVLSDSHGQIWAAAFGGGLLRVRNPLSPAAVIERLEYENRLPGSPRSLYEDRDGNVWVGMRGGLIRLTQSTFASVGPLEGITNEGVRTAAVDRDGAVWVATGHALNRFTPAGRTTIGLAQTMALHADSRGVVWAAGSQQLHRIVNGRIEPVPIPELAASRVMAMTTDAAGTMWLCTGLKGVMTWDGRTVSRFDDHRGIANRGCQSIYADRQGRIWFGLLTGGASVYEKGAFQRITVRDGLPGGTVLAITEDAKGAIWLATSTGVSRVQSGRVTSITQANAPLADVVPVLVEDLDGYLWVGVNSGAAVLRFHPSEVDKVAANPAYQLEYAIYDESDGMQQGSQTWQSGVGSVRGGDGRLWVATGVGMTVIDPARLPPSRRPPPPRIEAVAADGRGLAPLGETVLPSRTSTIHVEYGAVSLSSASKLRYRYMLEGLDEDWVYAGSDREATYTGVAPGSYRFRVSATTTGEWTDATAWAFVVAPPFYRTRAFVVLTTLGTVLLLGAVWLLRLRAVRNQYALVFAERARVSREIHDTLLQSLAAIGVELETISTQLGDQQDPARDALRRLRRQVGHSLREARESILELRNTALRPRALEDALRELAEKTTTSKRIPTTFTVSGRPRPCAGDADVQLLRIAQEAINNAVRHSRAGTIRMSLAFERDRVVLTITDDGRGFVPDERDPAPASGEHLGLLTMRERAARIRGRFALTSSPGAGTTIEAVAPLPVE